jgi:fibronectin type 3 domain-containing protein
MNVEGLNSGLYIVRLTTGDDQRSMRVVIQH